MLALTLESKPLEASLGRPRFYQGQARSVLSLVSLQNGEVPIVVTRSEEDVLALGHRKEHAQRLADLVVSALLASSDINKAKERLGQSEMAAKVRDLVHTRHNATAVEVLR